MSLNQNKIRIIFSLTISPHSPHLKAGMETLATIQVKLDKVEQEIEEAKAKLETGKLTSDAFTALAAHLREEKKALKDEIAKARNPVPAPAPPGNFITLPHVLPLSFIIFSSSLPPPLFLQNSNTAQLQPFLRYTS